MQKALDISTLSPPKSADTIKEVLAPIEWLGTFLKARSLLSLPKGNGKCVMLAPGYMADEWSMIPLKQFLTRLNYRMFDWGQGRNSGKVDALIESMALHISSCQQRHQLSQPFTLIGWSLGGVISREVARLYPDLVEEVITLGSPITGGPKYTAVAKRYAKRENIDLDDFEQHVMERNQQGIKQPVSSIYSKTDGIVGWQAAVDTYNAQARNIEVNGSHLGLGINAKVWRIIATILSEKPHEKPKARTL